MGRPAHYSLDIVTRCRSLVEHLLPIVQNGLPEDKRHGGPLSTTFLLSMATPMIALPIERIFKPGRGDNIVADDTGLNDGLSEEVARVFDDKTQFQAAPFHVGDWRLVRNAKPFNIADWGNDEIFAALEGDAASKAAREATARFMLIHLRNALAHGGIIYLDAKGRLNDARADMLGFVSAKTKDHKITGLHVSRISEADFLALMRAWADWIERSGMDAALSVDPPLVAASMSMAE